MAELSTTPLLNRFPAPLRICSACPTATLAIHERKSPFRHSASGHGDCIRSRGVSTGTVFLCAASVLYLLSLFFWRALLGPDGSNLTAEAPRWVLNAFFVYHRFAGIRKQDVLH